MRCILMELAAYDCEKVQHQRRQLAIPKDRRTKVFFFHLGHQGQKLVVELRLILISQQLEGMQSGKKKRKLVELLKHCGTKIQNVPLALLWSCNAVQFT